MFSKPVDLNKFVLKQMNKSAEREETGNSDTVVFNHVSFDARLFET